MTSLLLFLQSNLKQAPPFLPLPFPPHSSSPHFVPSDFSSYPPMYIWSYFSSNLLNLLTSVMWNRKNKILSLIHWKLEPFKGIIRQPIL